MVLNERKLTPQDNRAHSGRQLHKKSMISTTNQDKIISRFLDWKFANDFFETNLGKIGMSNYELARCNINHLKGHHRKAVIEFTLDLNDKITSAPAKKSIIGKIKTGADRHSFDFLQDIWNNGFSSITQSRNHFMICEPIAYFQEFNLMITSKANGVELGNIIRNTNDHRDVLSDLKQVAGWITKLHRTKNIKAHNHSIDDDVKKLGLFRKNLSSLQPHLADRLMHITTHILESKRLIDPNDFALIHGDFHPMNIFIDGLNVTVVDFDRSCYFDAAKDLGYFLGHLVMTAKKSGTLTESELELKNHFLKYYSGNDVLSSEFLEKIRAFEANSYLEHLNFIYCTFNKRLDPQDFEYWLNMAENCIRR